MGAPMNRRNILNAMLALPLLSGCYKPGPFDLEWDEEILLPDGRVIVAHMTRTYMRLESSLSEFGGISSPRDTTMEFDAGSGAGVVKQLFMGFRPMFLGQKDGVWYAILIGGYRFKNRSIPGQDWGDSEGPHGQWAIKLVGGKWQPTSLRAFPTEFQYPNVLMSGTAEELSVFHQKQVTLKDKAAWLEKHPLGINNIAISRPLDIVKPNTAPNTSKEISK
jgi:hypothetical protein